ncbi:hypothetical protein Q5425_34955 [Amycolatopsis sp. A133]|uniref:tetratricopeptide repeat protein n=1 Tax=Amycolatopsis sp. A133 TaxID=3064472 RepID=UPI0027EA152B|nr:hypothetical protein [Amycolatopsis sp. A133]MDQ7808963.1 hypothetical protein [Amycolatopsis sp. A133]
MVKGDVHLHSPAPHGPAPGPARPITAWNPFDLGVHRAITVGGAPAGDRLPALPGYLRRPHDDELADLLDDVSTNVMVVLSGESSTGKTRALYESVLTSRTLRDWPLHYPRTADDLLRLLHSGGISARTVLWLNETHNHLSGPTGDLAAAALRDLLDGSHGGPFAVVGTLWPQFWAEFVAQPRSGQRDEHANARALLQHRARRIRVAEQLSSAEMARVCATAAVDPRLAAAASASGDGRRVIQTMAGGPMLVERFEHPDDEDDRYATAILTAAVDARRLGHLQPLPRVLLDEAAVGYLGERDRVNAPGDWFTRGLKRAADEALLGVTALVARRKQPGTGPPDGYELHDYLDQHGRTARRWAPAPAELWEACVAHTEHPEDLVRLTENAYQRLLYRYADPLVERTLALADPGYQSHLVDVLAEYGRVERATAVLRAADELGLLFRVSRHSHESTTTLLIESGRLAEAELFLETLATSAADTRWAWWTLTTLLVDTGRTEEAIELLQRLRTRGREAVDTLADEVTTGRLPAITAARHLKLAADAIEERLADLLADAGRWGEALDVVQTGTGDWPCAWLARKFADHGRLDRLEALAEVGDADVSLILAEKLLEADQVPEALRLVDGAGSGDPSPRLLELLVQHGRHELAISTGIPREGPRSAKLLRALAAALLAHGHRDRLSSLLKQLGEAAAVSFSYTAEEIPEAVADLLADLDCWDEALKIARRDSAWARRWVAHRLAAAGNLVQVRRLAEMGHEHAGAELVRHLVGRRRSREAFALLGEFAGAGLDWADRELAVLLAEAGRWDELVTRATAGSPHAARTLLASAHQALLPDAGRLLDRGLSPHGRA